MNMPQNLMGQEKKGPVDIDLSSLSDDGLNQSISFEQTEKPVLKKPTEGVVTGFRMQRYPELKFNETDPSKKYYRVYLYIETKFINPESEEEVTSSDGYGGLRFYPVLDNQGNPVLGDNGEPILDKWWSNNANSNNASYFSKLLALAQNFNSEITSYKDFFDFLNSNPKCELLTEYTGFGATGDKTAKEVIQKFI